MSDDVDIFHDIAEAVHREFERDRALLERAGLTVRVSRQWETFVQATAATGDEIVRLQWALDSAFRYFPLVEHPDFGLALHPFDLATNKVLALIGRAEPRDWVDIIECGARLQPLGYLVWAAAGKDPGLNPAFILEQAARSARYTEIELAQVAFEGERPTAASLSRRWKADLGEARSIVSGLPAAEAGKCVLDAGGDLLRAPATSLSGLLAAGRIRFHEGTLRGAYPTIV